MPYTEEEIARIAAGVLDLSLPKPEWTHAAHFACALWMLTHRDAEAEMPGAIRAYNAATGVPSTPGSCRAPILRGRSPVSPSAANMRRASPGLRFSATICQPSSSTSCPTIRSRCRSDGAAAKSLMPTCWTGAGST